MIKEVDPRTETDAQIARALEIVVDADENYAGDGATLVPRRDYTAEELDQIFFSLIVALVQLAKVPGGKEAKERAYEKARAELRRRGREDLIP